MIVKRQQIVFTLLVLFTLLSITSAIVCPNNPPSNSGDKEQYLVFLKPLGLLGIVLTLADHLLMMVLCLNFQEEKFKSGEGLFGNGPINENLITDLSADGVNGCYTGFFTDDVVSFLEARPDVDFVEKVKPVKADYAIRPVIIKENDLEKRTTQTSAPYNLDRIDQRDFPLDTKFNYPTDAGLESNVYVVDTGIDISNVEFEGRASHGGTFCSGCSSTDDHGHGTNVAGIIGGKKYGVSKKTKLIAVKVLNQYGQGTSATVTAGLSFVISKHKASSNKNTIINMSFGGGISDAINKMVSDCFNAGIHTVASAGDTGGDACTVSPASAPQAITVGGTEKTTNDIASFSNTGSCVDIYAPGRDIVAAGASDVDTALSIASGTSQAAPHVAGTIALIISKQNNASPSSMTNTLISLSTKNILTDSIPNNRFLFVPTP